MDFSKFAMAAMVATASLIGAVTPADATIYNVNLSSGLTSITGTITTDSTLGTLFGTNITNFAIAMTDGSVTTNISGPLYAFTGVSGFTATSGGLFFDFDRTGVEYFQFIDSVNGGILCFNAVDSACNTAGSASSILYMANFGWIVAEIPMSGYAQFATAASTNIPEPLTLTLVGAGLAGMALTRRRGIKAQG